MTSVVIAVLVAFGLMGLGLSIVRLLDQNRIFREVEALAIGFLIGPLFVYLAVYSIGPWRYDFVSMAGVAVLLAPLSIWGLKGVRWAEVVPSIGTSWIDRGLLALIFGVGVTSLLQGLAPPNDWDSLIYHLALPKFDLELGALTVHWGRGLAHEFYPELLRHLTRFILALSDAETAQIVHGMFSISTAVLVAAMLRRLGYGNRTQLIGALFFLLIRTIIWQMATVEADAPLAAYTMASVLTLYLLRDCKCVRMSVLLGVLIGAGVLAKYVGLVFSLCIGAVLLWDVFHRRLSIITAAIVPGISILVASPHFIKNFFVTGNPIFPLYNQYFHPSGYDMFEGLNRVYGAGYEVQDLFYSLWNIFINPAYYDGMQFGGAYLLAFIPLAFLFPRRGMGILVVVLAVYYFLWFWFLGQAIRFLIPVMPIMAILAAMGLSSLIERSQGATRAIVVGLAGIFVANQLLFAGAYAMIRLPVSLGLQSPGSYHSTPLFDGGGYHPCNYVNKNSTATDRTFSLSPVLYYCRQSTTDFTRFPTEDQKSWVGTSKKPTLTKGEVIEALKVYRFLLIPMNRAGVGEDRVISDAQRLAVILRPALYAVQAEFEGVNVAVYDARAVLKALSP